MYDRLAAIIRGKKLVILGVGNSLQGDDGLGPELIDRLQGRVRAALVNGGEVPVNYLSMIAAIHPELVLVVGAVDIGADPGQLVVLDFCYLEKLERCRHHQSLTWLVRMIEKATSAQVILAGVQPGVTGFAEEQSKPVLETVNVLAKFLEQHA